MKKPGEFDVVAQVEQAARTRAKLHEAVFLIVALVVLAAFAGWRSVQPPVAVAPTSKGVETFVLTGTGVSMNVPQVLVDWGLAKYQPVPDGIVLEGFHQAVRKWRDEFGGKLPIRYPRIVRVDAERSEVCIAGSLAYAEPVNNRIVFCRLYNADPTTLMMHAHLLGVPHIQDDALMNATQNGAKLDKPTRAAVALAKLAYPDKD
jgi:hypothetical protein